MHYAKQRELLTNLDKKLDYRNLQKDRHPYINDLRSFMNKKHKNDNSQVPMDYEARQEQKADEVLVKNFRFTTTQMDSTQKM